MLSLLKQISVFSLTKRLLSLWFRSLRWLAMRSWSLATSFLSGASAAVGVALINSIGNLAGFVGPYLVGWIKTETGGFSWALLTLAVGPLATAVIVLRLRHLVK